jgi:putative nicotinate-nucleotide--dimethylbenzimidazole phosphoribosyltransferase
MSWVPGLRSHKLGMGTKNFVEEPAMTREQAIEGIEAGIRLVKEKIDEGFNVFLVGEMGISNTTASALMTAKFAGLTAEEATGRGTNISDERLKLKQRIVHDVLEKYKDIPKDDAIGILSSVGGFEFACIVGVILGAAANNGLVIIDGFNTSACALVAKTLVPEVMDYVMASHLSAEKAAKSSLENLGLEAYVDLGLCLGEASGSSVQMGMLDLAVHMYMAITGGEA